MCQSEDHHHGHQHVIIIDQNGKRLSRFRFEFDENESDQYGECTKKHQQRYPTGVRLETKRSSKSIVDVRLTFLMQPARKFPNRLKRAKLIRTIASMNWISTEEEEEDNRQLLSISERTWEKESRRRSFHLSQDTGEESNRRKIEQPDRCTLQPDLE